MEAGFDSFEDSRRVLERLFELGQAAGALDPVADAKLWDELASQAAAVFADDVELVTRDGTLRGSDRLISDWRIQTRRFKLRFERLRYLDVGDGRIIALYTLVRTARQGNDHMTAWPATVCRVRNGRIVFFDAFPDHVKALNMVGLDPAIARSA